MKSILQFEAVRSALEQVVAESDKTNGTRGLELYCYYWNHENQFDEKRQTLMNEMGRLVLLGKPEDAAKVRDEIEKLDKPKIIMEFKLMQPIPMVRGTKTMTDGSKMYTIQAENVVSIFIPQDSLYGDLAEFEETDDVAKDILGRDTKVIKLKIKKGILDVASEQLDIRDSRKPLEQRRIRVPKRVYLTAMSYHTLQIVGRLKAQEENARFRRFGFTEQL